MKKKNKTRLVCLYPAMNSNRSKSQISGFHKMLNTRAWNLRTDSGNKSL